MVLLAPSVLSADFADLKTCVERAQNGGADYLHYDVMDGNFVPNLTVGPVVLKDMARIAAIPIDVHLMIVEPGRYMKDYHMKGVEYITVHAEATDHLHRDLTAIRELGAKAGVSLNPATPECVVGDMLPFLDLVLVMTVNPGFGGQKFIPEILPKVERLRKMIDESGRKVVLQVDGGITPDNIASVVKAGGEMFVAGSAVFGKSGDGDIEGNLKRLREAAEG